MTMNKYILGCATLLLSLQTVLAQKKAAQDTAYNQKVVLEREYNPVFRDASRIEMLPPIVEPKSEKAPIQYQYSKLETQLPLQWKTLAPEKKLDEYDYAHQTGFFNLGLGLPANSLFNGGLTLLDDEINLLNVSVDHRAINDRRTASKSYGEEKVYSSDTKVQFDYTRPFQLVGFNASAAFTHSEFNYFGQGSPDLRLYFALPEFTRNQAHNILNLSAQINSTEDTEISYKGMLTYNFFDKKIGTFQNSSGPNEHHVLIEGELTKKQADNRQLGLNFALNNFVYSISDIDTKSDFAPKTYGLMSFRPYYTIDADNYKLTAGMNGEFVLNNGMRIHLAPVLNGIWEFTPHFFALGNIGGGTHIRSFSDADINTRYLLPSCRLSDTYTAIDGQFSIKTNIIPRLEMELHSGYKSGDEYYYMTQNYYETNYIQPVALTNTQQYSVGLSATYDIKDRGNIHLQLNQYSYRLKFNPDLNNQNRAWDKPTFEMMIDGNLKINEKINAQIEYRLATGRYGLLKDGNEYTSQPMNAVNVLNLNGRYKINKNWSAFAQLNNILFQKYDLWMGMPAQNFNFVVGTGFSY